MNSDGNFNIEAVDDLYLDRPEITSLIDTARFENRPIIEHIPNRTEVEALLRENFVGPVIADHVDHIVNALKQAVDSSYSHYSQSFMSLVAWRGTQWYERIPKTQTLPLPVDIVSMIGTSLARQGEFLAPKLYCPDSFVGTWEQVQPETKPGNRILWHLNSDSTFRTEYPIPHDTVPPRHWSIVKSFVPTETKVTIRFSQSHMDHVFSLYDVEPNQEIIIGESYDPRIEFRLVRVR